MSIFWFHYNKPASAKAGRPKLTVHHKGQCILQPTWSHNRKQQPRLVIKGNANKFEIIDNVAVIE